MDISVQVTGKGGEFIVSADLIFGALAIAQDGLGGFLIVPKVRLGDTCFQGFQAFAMGSGVKDSSEPW
jgi:hypothetical protein